jgi:hypothetical protein
VHVPTICIARMRFNGVTFNYAESIWMAISRSSGNFFRANSPYLMGQILLTLYGQGDRIPLLPSPR